MTVVTVKKCPSDFTDLPSLDLGEAFCNTLSAGDGKFWSDGRNLKQVTVTLILFHDLNAYKNLNKILSIWILFEFLSTH